MRALLLPLLASTMCLVGPSASQNAGPSRAWIKVFERSLDLDALIKNDPAHDRPVRHEDFARYYILERVGGEVRVWGRYLPPQDAWRDNPALPKGTHIGEPPLPVLDGGCSVVTLLIVHESFEVVRAFCNGRA
ncbi:MAG: hypothetical protein K2X07_12680 [Caulobacteraceae bacterium]|nr:hypothetical protein [Caulobacteraceae bacterium]